jgi:hypothetical protein
MRLLRKGKEPARFPATSGHPPSRAALHINYSVYYFDMPLIWLHGGRVPVSASVLPGGSRPERSEQSARLDTPQFGTAQKPARQTRTVSRNGPIGPVLPDW